MDDINSVTRFGEFLHFGQLLKHLATINLAKSPTFLGNFCKGFKIYHFFSEINFGQLLQTFGDFFLVTLDIKQLWQFLHELPLLREILPSFTTQLIPLNKYLMILEQIKKKITTFFGSITIFIQLHLSSFYNLLRLWVTSNLFNVMDPALMVMTYKIPDFLCKWK